MSDSDEEVIQEQHNPRYNLRPLVRPPDRYFASIVKNNAAYSLYWILSCSLRGGRECCRLYHYGCCTC